MFSKSSRMDRAYNKQMKQIKTAREKRRQQLIKSQRVKMPSLRETPPPSPEQISIQAIPASQNQ